MYINGDLHHAKRGVEGSFEKDVYTKLTVGKPNHIDKHFGRFQMELLAVYYYQLAAENVQALWGSKSCLNKHLVFLNPFRLSNDALQIFS